MSGYNKPFLLDSRCSKVMEIIVTEKRGLCFGVIVIGLLLVLLQKCCDGIMIIVLCFVLRTIVLFVGITVIVLYLVIIIIVLCLGTMIIYCVFLLR